MVVLPIAGLSGLAPLQVEAILAHELAHVRRHDFVVNVLQTIAETVLFYHPAVWWISGRIRDEREHCCDDIAVSVCGDPVAYATALTEIASTALTRPSLAVAAVDGSLLARVRRLIVPAGDDAPRTSSRVVLVALAATLLAVTASVRAITVAQGTAATPARAGIAPDLGPAVVNRLVGFGVFPTGQHWPTADPPAARAWGVTIRYANSDMPLLGFTGRSLIRHAYSLPDIPIVDAPRWLDEESFDLEATTDVPVAAGIAEPRQVDALLRDLLERRLGLVAHVERRELPVYALVKANADERLGPGLARSTSDCVRGDLSLRVFSPQFCGIDNDLTGIRAQGVTMAEFAAHVRARDALAPDLPIVDRTGLSGSYDFRVRFGFVPVAAIGAEHPTFGALLAPFGFRTFFTALPEQLGLRLERSSAPFDVLVVDEIRRP